MEKATTDTAPSSPPPRSFEQDLINQVAREFLFEQRRSRRWGVFFKLLLALYLFAFLVIYVVEQWDIDAAGFPGRKHTALVDIEGVIAADAEASADHIVAGLRAAFENERTVGVIVRINSPGGSPVQA
ncbi:MAG: S49 family peptidase, partial [Gammaproteobacteria bacterium]|nr:S49 family peptidase [Gammaproteobacteria bacterium]